MGLLRRSHSLLQQYAWKDVFYTPQQHILQSMNIATPKKRQKQRSTCIFVHGGSWQRGDKAGTFNKGIEESMAKAGFAGISINYRLSPDIKHPLHTEDVAAAIGWIHRNINTYGGDPERMVIIGHSAGAHLVMNALADPRFLRAHGIEPTVTKRMVQAVVGISGVYNIVRLANAPWYGSLFVHPVFGDSVHAWREASILSVLTKERQHSPLPDLPILLLNAQEDFHLAQDAQELASWIENHRVTRHHQPQEPKALRPPYAVIPDCNHFTIVKELTENPTGKVMQAISDFLEHT